MIICIINTGLTLIVLSLFKYFCFVHWTWILVGLVCFNAFWMWSYNTTNLDIARGFSKKNPDMFNTGEHALLLQSPSLMIPPFYTKMVTFRYDFCLLTAIQSVISVVSIPISLFTQNWTLLIVSIFSLYMLFPKRYVNAFESPRTHETKKQAIERQELFLRKLEPNKTAEWANLMAEINYEMVTQKLQEWKKGFVEGIETA